MTGPSCFFVVPSARVTTIGESLGVGLSEQMLPFYCQVTLLHPVHLVTKGKRRHTYVLSLLTRKGIVNSLSLVTYFCNLGPTLESPQPSKLSYRQGTEC